LKKIQLFRVCPKFSGFLLILSTLSSGSLADRHYFPNINSCSFIYYRLLRMKLCYIISMKSSTKSKFDINKAKRILLYTTIATVAFIWIHSMMPADASSQESGWVMDLIRPLLEIFVGKGNVTMYLVRKLAHFTEYFVLGAQLSIYYILSKFWGNDIVTRKSWPDLLPLAIGLAIAAVDETIQIFSDGRGPAVKDVLLDFCGVLAAYIIVGIIFKYCIMKKECYR